MGGGSNKTQENTQAAITQEQLRLAETQQTQAAADRERMQKLQQPSIDKETALATGDAKTALSAAMPVVSKLSAGYDAAKQSIFNTLAPGAARDKALADLEVSKATGTAGATASLVQAAPDKLANIGAGLGSFSLQELGAALSGFQGAGTSNDQAMESANQKKANTMSLFGSLAQTAGTAVGSKFWK